MSPDVPADPADPIAAVTHPNPYPYYRHLVAEAPLYRDESRGLWVAASAAAVTAALTHDLCRVRPPAEPVPRALVGSPAGEIFRQLVRMNDGRDRCPLKAAISTTLASVDGPMAERESQRWARHLAAGIEAGDPGAVTRFAFSLSSHVVASLLGVPSDRLRETALWTGDLVRGFAPAASADDVEQGNAAAGKLIELFHPLLASSSAGTDGTVPALLPALAREAQRLGREDTGATGAVVANAVGFLSQAYEATAGLIGNTLLALATHSGLREPDGHRLLPGVVEEVQRWDPPVQNTRRFLTGSGSVAGQEMGEGDTILVLLAAANRDLAANPEPDRFDASRQDRRSFTFGTGGHACPGQALAMTIARAGVEQLLAAGVDPERLAGTVTYRLSANTRVPIFGEAAPCT